MKHAPLQSNYEEKLQTSTPITKEKVTSKPSTLNHSMSFSSPTLPNDVTYNYSNNNKMSNPYDIVENEETTIINEDCDDEAYGETTNGPESEFEFDFDEEAFESHLRNITSFLKDDFSCSTFETENPSDSSSLDLISSIESMYLSWFDDFFIRAYERLEKEMKEMRDNFFVPSHIEGRYQGKCARTSSTKGLHIDFIPIFDSNPSSPLSKNDISLKSSSFKRSNITPVETSCTSSAHHEPHPLGSSFTSCLSSLDESELELNSNPTSFSISSNEKLEVNDLSICLLCDLQSSSKLENSYSKENDNKFASETLRLSSHTSFKSSLRTDHESKFKYLKNSRFTSTSIIFRDRPKKSSNSAPKSSSSLCSYATHKENTSLHLSKEIKGPNKTLASPHHKTIIEETLGFNNPFRSSHLGTSTCGKPKIKATKHSKSPS